MNNPRYKEKHQGAEVKRRIVLSPSRLDLYSPKCYEKCLKFIRECEAVQDGEELVISFAYCKELKAAAQVVISAKIEMLLREKNINVTVRKSQKSSFVNAHLEKCGFFSLCEQKCTTNQFDGDNVLLMVSSQDKHEIDRITDFVIEQAYGEHPSPEQEKLIGAAIGEAHYNVILHAYKNLSTDKRWWLRCSIIDDELYLIIYDNGIGFAQSLDEKNANFTDNNWVDILQNFINQLGIKSDVSHLSNAEAFSYFQNKQSQLIYIAMTERQTGMEGELSVGHGRGSKSIKALVNEHSDGKLWVFSHYGKYVYSNEAKPPLLYDHKQSLNGTLIQWNIKL